MKLTAEQIKENWEQLLSYIDKYISSPRKEKLLDFYKKFEDRLALMPAAHKKEYHNAFPGGYVEHVNRVVRCSLKQYELWKEEGVNTSTFTIEELVFSAINHDLGKMGDEENESYIPQTDKWKNSVVSMFSKADVEFDVKDIDSVGDMMLYTRAWYWISQFDFDDKECLNDLKLFLDKDSETYNSSDLFISLMRTIKYFEKTEEFEKCAFLVKIRDLLK